PVGPVVAIDVAELKVDLLLAQHDRRALDPRTGLEAHQQISRHDALAGTPARTCASFPRFNSLVGANTSARRVGRGPGRPCVRWQAGSDFTNMRVKTTGAGTRRGPQRGGGDARTQAFR